MYSNIAVFEDRDGELHTEEDKMEIIWNDYIHELFGDENRKEPNGDESRLENAPEITMEELETVIKNAGRRKAVGVDGIPVEIIKVAGRKMKCKLLTLLNKIYKTG